MSRQGIIYKITNIVNGNCYIGQTIDYQARVRDHLNRAEYGNEILYKAMRKYGKDNFKFEKLITCNEHDLDAKEVELISELKTHRFTHGQGYNMTFGGMSVRGSKRSDESKIAYSISKRGSKNPNYGKPSSMSGKKHSTTTLQKMSSAKTGVKISDEKAKKLHDSQRYIGISLPDEVRYNNLIKYHLKPLECDGKFFANIAILSKYSGLSSKVFSRLMNANHVVCISKATYLANIGKDPIIAPYIAKTKPLSDFGNIKSDRPFSIDFEYIIQASKNIFVKDSVWRAKVSKANTGKVTSQETKDKLSKLNGTPIEYKGVFFQSRSKAAQHFGVDIGFINRRLKDGSATYK